MKRLKTSQFSEQQDQNEYKRQQKAIQQLIEKYKEKRKNQLYNEIKNAFFNYQQLLEMNYASPAKWTWLSDKKVIKYQFKAQVNALKNQKATENQEQVARNFVKKEHIQLIKQEVFGDINQINKHLQQAVQVSTYIKAQLNDQIQCLDRIYDVNKDTDVRIKRSMDGLRAMMRRIMLSKITRCLSIITVFAIIALLVVYVLKNNGTIS